ncbi:MAG: hypothetical protein MZV70_56535 [Desulfobacterales bacterium]|nr:hypothetical protein [Desulfobacterales bacterium]
MRRSAAAANTAPSKQWAVRVPQHPQRAAVKISPGCRGSNPGRPEYRPGR